jgi:hypothetical protein
VSLQRLLWIVGGGESHGRRIEITAMHDSCDDIAVVNSPLLETVGAER